MFCSDKCKNVSDWEDKAPNAQKWFIHGQSILTLYNSSGNAKAERIHVRGQLDILSYSSYKFTSLLPFDAF